MTRHIPSLRAAATIVGMVLFAAGFAGCPLPYQFSAESAGSHAANQDPATPSITATPFLAFTKTADGSSGTVVSGEAHTTNGDTTVAIETETVGAVIYYTTDGSVPDPRSESTLQFEPERPIRLQIADPTPANSSVTANVTAVAIGPGMKPSATMEASVTVHYPQAAPVTFEPGEGGYMQDTLVELSTETEGATIYYTSSQGDTPPEPVPGDAATHEYAQPIPVAGHGTTVEITAIAVAAEMLDSAPTTATYAINYDTVPQPTFSVSDGTYQTDQSVAISTTADGAAIWYTTDGSEPAQGGNEYTGPITIAGPLTTTTVKALATMDGKLPSAVATVTVTVDWPASPTPVFTPVGDTYSSDQSVTLAADGADEIWYRVDVGEYTLYDSPITVEGHGTTATIHAYSVTAEMDDSPTVTEIYTIDYDSLAAPTFSVSDGTYQTDQSVAISTTADGATIWYTTDGSEPAQGGNEYTGPITIAGPLTTTTVKALATMDGKLPSAVATVTVTVDWPVQPAPTFSVAGGVYATDQSVTMTASGADTIYYQLNGGGYAVYDSSAITIAGDGKSLTIDAYAVRAGYDDSATVSESYTIDYIRPDPPTATVASGTFANDFTVQLDSPTAETSLYYTTDGSAPQVLADGSPGGTTQREEAPYNLLIDGTKTVSGVVDLRVIAKGAQTKVSNEVQRSYTLQAAAPTISPTTGLYFNPKSVDVATATIDATLNISILRDGVPYSTLGTAESHTISLTTDGTYDISVTTSKLGYLDSAERTASLRVATTITYAELTETECQFFEPQMSTANISNYPPIPQGTVMVYRTSDGNYGKLVVTLNPEETENDGIEILFTTFGGSAAADTTNVIRGTFNYNLDTGLLELAGSDVWVNHVSATERYFSPKNLAKFYVVDMDPAYQ